MFSPKIKEHISKYKNYIGGEILFLVLLTTYMLIFTDAPHYLLVFLDFIMGLLFTIIHGLVLVNEEQIRLLCNIESWPDVADIRISTGDVKFSYSKKEKKYRKWARSIKGDEIIAYHPMQNIKKITELTDTEISEIKHIYECIRKEIIKKYTWYVEIVRAEQLEGLLDRVKFLKSNYKDLIIGGRVPIYIHECTTYEDRLFPFHFQITIGDSEEEKNLVIGIYKEDKVSEGILVEGDGKIYHLFDKSLKEFLRKEKSGEWKAIIDEHGNIDIKLLKELCMRYNLTFPKELER